MKSINLVIPDLFLPQHVAAEACESLALPALLTLFARARSSSLSFDSLESWLCDKYGVDDQAIAPVSLLADGLEPEGGYWLRADPINLYFQQNKLIMNSEVLLTFDEATHLCSSLNSHFHTDGLRFFSPHPQRWYLQLDAKPNITTHHLAQVAGKNVHEYLPQGLDALRWHGIYNEIQMLLFEHAVNQARETLGKEPVNSMWFWGGGYAVGNLAQPCVKMISDSELANIFAQAAGVSHVAFTDEIFKSISGNELIVWEGLRFAVQRADLQAWREGVLHFERCCAEPLLAALRCGNIDLLTLDVLQSGGASRRFELTRSAAWKLWQRPKPLAWYSV